MIRTPAAVAGLAALMMVAAPALAQQTAKPTPQAATPQTPTPGSDDWLRQRGESYHSAPESAQDPVEVTATAKLNEGIAARNEAAEQADTAEETRFNSENQRWQDDTARSNTARVQWEADTAAANAAQAQWERQRAAYEAEVAACRASGRRCILTPPAPR